MLKSRTRSVGTEEHSHRHCDSKKLPLVELHVLRHPTIYPPSNNHGSGRPGLLEHDFSTTNRELSTSMFVSGSVPTRTNHEFNDFGLHADRSTKKRIASEHWELIWTGEHRRTWWFRCWVWLGNSSQVHLGLATDRGSKRVCHLKESLKP